MIDEARSWFPGDQDLEDVSKDLRDAMASGEKSKAFCTMEDAMQEVLPEG